MDTGNSITYKYKQGSLSYLGRVSYNYADKYLFQFLFRSDASTKFAPSNYWGFFPGVSVGWVASEEGFMKKLLPSWFDVLKEEEKAQIMAWLVEAREFAMDAENSNKKHAAFGKYKGRINNYLSKRGYDLVKERKAWYERIKARGGKI